MRRCPDVTHGLGRHMAELTPGVGFHLRRREMKRLGFPLCSLVPL